MDFAKKNSMDNLNLAASIGDQFDQLTGNDCPIAIGELDTPEMTSTESPRSSAISDTADDGISVAGAYLSEESSLAAGDYVNKDEEAQGCLIDGLMTFPIDGKMKEGMLEYQNEGMVESQNDDLVEPESYDMAEGLDDGSEESQSAGKLAGSTEKILKHPLQHVWTLWYLENDRSKSWEDMQNEITSFDTVEDFWSLYNHISPPSELKLGSDYSLFKKDIRPMWEDAANNNGGRWVITLNKMLNEDLDKLWLDVLLCLIGEVFDHLDQICGAVVNIRGKTNKISLWTSNGNHKEAILEIGHKLREALRLSPQNILQYQLHKDTMVKQGASVKSTYTL